MKEFDSLTDNRPMILKLAEKQAGMAHKNLFEPAFTLGKPSKDSKHYKESMAMDACCRNVLSGALKNDFNLSVFPSFVGYGMLSNLSQEGLIRAGVETIADDMTRKPIEPYYDDEGGEEEEDKITKLKTEMIKYKVREAMNTALLKDGYFGGCLVYIDVGELEDDEAEEPLVLDEKTFKKGSLRGFKVIEPVNIAPGTYNTTDPTSDDYFNPEWYYILGRKYHKSRFLYFASNETPLLLKAAYNFFGIPQAQLALDYVAHFVANRESAQKLLNKFSLTCFGTNMSQGLQTNGSWADLVKRVKMFNKIRDNNGAFVYDKETEELSQINTPLGGVREIVEMSLNLLTAIWRIPKIRYIGEGEGGMNASSVEQMRSYYDYINAMQEKVLTTPYETVLKILQLNLGMKPDEKLLFKFPVLWDMDEQERANLNKIKADTMAIYLANGIISQEEARRSLSMDKNSGFTMLDAEDVPEPVEQPLKDVDKEEQDEEDKEAMDMALDGRWITIGARKKGEEGEDDEGRKGRHIYLDDGKTPEEAIKDLEDKKDNIEKPKKEEKKVEEPKDKTKEQEFEKEKKSKAGVGKKEYGELDARLRKLMYEQARIEEERTKYINENEELKELFEQRKIAQNRLYQHEGNTEENEKAFNDIQNKINEKYDELEKEYSEKNDVDGIKKKISDIDKAKRDVFEEMKGGYLEKTSKMTDEELKSRLSELYIRRRDVQNKHDEALSNNLEYKDAMMRKSDLLDARWAIVRKDYLNNEDNKKLSKINDELRKAERKCEDFITEYESQKTVDTIEFDAEIQAISQEETKRFQAYQKKKKEDFEKAKQERAKKGKELAKENYYPKTIAGVPRGKEMSEEEADSGNPNPNYGNGRGYGINCQSCVVCYEARLRGYNVMTRANTRDSKLSQLAHDTNLAWIDPKTGLEPEPMYINAKGARQCLKFLEENIKNGERYNFSFGWKRSREGHIVSIARNKKGDVEIYDPQTNKRATGNELFEYLRRLSYGDRTKVRIYGDITGGAEVVSKTELLRVDNLAFNPDFMNDIMEARK